MEGTAILYTHHRFTSLSAKTAHGLLRHGKRYRVLAIIDESHAGQDAGTLLDGVPLGIPIYDKVSSFVADSGMAADFCIIGIASAGGKIDPAWIPELQDAVRAGMSLVNGMHQLLEDLPEIAALAKENGVALIDVRKPKPLQSLAFWSGKIDRVGCPIVPVLGTDCAVGKRTTARFLESACSQRGLRAEMVYTGQTGWLQGGKHGFVFDSTPNDFVSGELERAIVDCWEDVRPDLILVEGQSALRNPSGPCGSEMLVSGRADACILVHPVGREYYKGWESLGRRIPEVSDEIALILGYGVPTIGLALNTWSSDLPTALAAQQTYAASLQLPVCVPLVSGVEALVDALVALVQEGRR